MVNERIQRLLEQLSELREQNAALIEDVGFWKRSATTAESDRDEAEARCKQLRTELKMVREQLTKMTLAGKASRDAGFQWF